MQCPWPPGPRGPLPAPSRGEAVGGGLLCRGRPRGVSRGLEPALRPSRCGRADSRAAGDACGVKSAASPGRGPRPGLFWELRAWPWCSCPPDPGSLLRSVGGSPAASHLSPPHPQRSRPWPRWGWLPGPGGDWPRAGTPEGTGWQGDPAPSPASFCWEPFPPPPPPGCSRARPPPPWQGGFWKVLPLPARPRGGGQGRRGPAVPCPACRHMGHYLERRTAPCTAIRPRVHTLSGGGTYGVMLSEGPAGPGPG